MAVGPEHTHVWWQMTGWYKSHGVKVSIYTCFDKNCTIVLNRAKPGHLFDTSSR